MITEDYCSFEVAKLLKEKGFDEDSYKIYRPNGRGGTLGWKASNTELSEHKHLCECISRPTHQMAMKWLREEGIFFCIHPDYPVSKNYIVEFYDDGAPSGFFGAYEKYEDAVEAALKYSLKNLI